MNCHIEIYLDGRWQIAATFEPYTATLDKGTEGECRLEYDVDYALENLHNPNAGLIPGLTVGFELFRFKSWPPFLIDLLPSGAGRYAWILRINGKNTLSPIFDFAPMFFDPEGINRVSRWEDEHPGSQPEWAAICEKLNYTL
jgi:hypothetical protein